MKKYIVTLSQEERHQLQAVVKKGKAAARTRLHAQILLQADTGAEGWTDEAISHALDVHPTTVANVRQRFVEEGIEAALHRRRARGLRRWKLDGTQDAHLIALACSNPAGGQARWSLRLLADKLVELQVVDTISYETVRQVLKKRPQAGAEKTMVYSARGKCGLCSADGRGLGGVHPAL
jgi:transposase